MNRLIHHGFIICDIRKWQEVGGRAGRREEPSGGINLRLISCTWSLTLMPRPQLLLPFVMFFFHNSSTFAKVLEVINTPGLGRLVSELPSPDGTRTGLFTPDNASKDTLLEFSFVHHELQAFLSHRNVGERLFTMPQATSKQLHHLRSLTVPQGWRPGEAASWRPLSVSLFTSCIL